MTTKQASELSASDAARYAPRGLPLNSCRRIPFDAWKRGEWSGHYTLHPDGFPIFLSPQAATDLDEYEKGDPYSTGDTPTAFWSWRLSVCVRLIEAARAERPVHTILDVGCGPGDMTDALAERFPDIRFTGVDGSTTAVGRGVRRPHRPSPAPDLCVADAFDLPFAEGTFDLVLMMNIWEHVTDPVAMARAAARVLTPAGRLVIATPSRYRTENLLRVLRGSKAALRSTQHVTEYSVGQVEEQLRWAGFRTTVCTDDRMPVAGGPLSALRRTIVGGLLSAWKRASGSHHAFGPTAFFVAAR